ncbi:MAG: phosphopentomutase [Gemmatimonadetes bacterium]|nr:phosphopentomutase [Gemmatimonadota bacterium]
MDSGVGDSPRRGRVVLVILDGVGIGEAPDTAAYGDAGSDTLGNVARAMGGLDLPFLEQLGLGCCRPLAGMPCAGALAAHGVALPVSKGKDSTAGHWELCGVILDEPFPVYPGGFPADVVARFEAATGRQVLANKAASGTAVIEEFGPQHLASGAWILYTSADSVFQIAAHEDTVSLEELYDACESARRMLTGEHAVSRVIARPFVGEPGAFARIAEHRRDFSVEPPAPTLLDRLAAAGIERVGVGKVDDLFAGRGITSEHASTNAEAFRLMEDALRAMDSGLLFANVIEFDQSWGHRNDVAGFYEGLRELDRALPRLIGLLREDDLMILTADHGNDPTTPSTDHSREAVPLLVVGGRIRPAALGSRAFADVGATVARYFGVDQPTGDSFLEQVLDDPDRGG